MVTVLMPMVCVVTPCWLMRGRFSSVAWLPFLNCACALPIQKARPRKIVRRKRNVLRIDTPSCREKRSFAEVEICWTNTPKAIDGKEGVSKQEEWRKRG